MGMINIEIIMTFRCHVNDVRKLSPKIAKVQQKDFFGKKLFLGIKITNFEKREQTCCF